MKMLITGGTGTLGEELVKEWEAPYTYFLGGRKNQFIFSFK